MVGVGRGHVHVHYRCDRGSGMAKQVRCIYEEETEEARAILSKSSSLKNQNIFIYDPHYDKTYVHDGAPYNCPVEAP